ncbi:hypothetical protein AB0D98_02270 [Streptomyces sp. NPDC047987]|uniref:hypothetical protein n=1 Tax=unclassified Streptomyces TaxID=2593676 RepID=UPI003412B3E7
MKTVRRAVAAAVAAGLLAACGSGGADDKAGNGASGGSSPSAGASPKPSVKAPEGFDTTKGWYASLDWLPEEQVSSRPPVEAVPKAGVVAFLQRKGERYVVEARDAVTGKLRWSSAQWQPPAPEDSEDEDVVPRLLVVNEDGREYVALWAYGQGKGEAASGAETSGEDAAGDEESKAVSFVFYPADSSGKDVAPVRTFAIPADADQSGVTVDAGGNGVAVRWLRPMHAAPDSATIDISGNRVQTYPEGKVELPPVCAGEGRDSCSSGEVAGLSPDGPVVALDTGGFGVGGVWVSRDAVPPGTNSAAPGDRVWQILGGHVIASWNPPNGVAGWGATAVMAVHDLKSGKLKTSLRCDTEAGPAYGLFKPVLSPNGRYAVAGTLAVDFERDQAHCLDDQAAAPVQLLSVGDDGIAYGYQKADSPSGHVPVAVPLDTGKARALPKDAEVPFLSLEEAGGFELPGDGPGKQFVFHPRR